MSTLNKTKELLNKYGLYAKKGFGQNFLVDDSVLEKIVEAGNLSSSDTVIEIGPGLGNLTEYLLNRAGKVIAFEIDKDMVNILCDRFAKQDNFELVNQDVLDVCLDKYITSQVKVIANLPYYITTPILFKLLEYRDKISSIVIMVQREVAQRLLAEPKSKEYGVLTVNTGYVSDMSLVTIVPNTSFVPAPNVTSAVVKMDINLDKLKNIKDEEMFKKLVKASFSARRKKVINSIMNSNLFNISKEQLTEYIKRIGFSECVRAEEISVDKYIELANMIKESTC